MTWDMHWVLGSNSAGYLKQLILPCCHMRLLLVYFHPIFLYIIMCNLRCELEFHFSFSKWILNWDQIDYQCCSQWTCSSFKQLRGRNSIFKLQIFLMDSSQKYYMLFCLIYCADTMEGNYDFRLRGSRVQCFSQFKAKAVCHRMLYVLLL